ncbi:hypothetical protein OUZ56_028687 [Daphnia magna]|uniref:Uncharacterized protein n=1 Tax=Daphnia magna TaxID=35525 RepID=A0ABR0B4L5_9CRUS|nr:hypothetical protein OUZ56_028687 [Daphnia magna]
MARYYFKCPHQPAIPDIINIGSKGASFHDLSIMTFHFPSVSPFRSFCQKNMPNHEFMNRIKNNTACE